MKEKKQSIWYKNSLSIVLIILLIGSLSAQILTGLHVKNDERAENHKASLSLIEYVHSGHFLQATFENWESEFLQMTLYILLTVSLRQKGSSESKKLIGENEVDREPEPHPNAPWPVRKGGIWLKLYSHSLSILFGTLFILSFLSHLYGSLKAFNEEQMDKGLQQVPWSEYIGQSRFWFESFQNWQSEFLAVAAIVIFSIWFREKGSPESKPVDTPNAQEA